MVLLSLIHHNTRFFLLNSIQIFFIFLVLLFIFLSAFKYLYVQLMLMIVLFFLKISKKKVYLCDFIAFKVFN